ncbi:MAG: cyclodeaminase/cyclohydrolase family protein [Actinobacteria bacterium]|nr:cyclodeaminase/cyclohydrolase family protein [Actinomycetota bacterium]
MERGTNDGVNDGVTERTILERIIDSRDRTVGGGSAAALAGGMAAGLAGLVARLSESGDFGLSSERCRALADEVDALAAQLQQGAYADADAYRAVVDAYRLPHDDPASESSREAAIQRAMVGAATVPRDNARAAHHVWGLCIELEGASNPNASSDLAVALLLAKTAVIGCVANIEINLPLIKDQATADELQREATSLRGSLAARAQLDPTEEGQ